MTYDVVVGVDTSDASRRAVDFACRLHSTGVIDGVLLVHVVPWSPFSFATPEEKAAEEQVLAPRRRFAAENGVEADIAVRHGDPVEVLEDLAGEVSARLLVVGRTGDTGLRQRIFGGLPSHLVQSAEVPVVVVP